MKAATFVKPYQIAVETVEKPSIQEETDAIIRVVRACVCGSDLWWYRGLSKRQRGSLVGHEAIGIVESVGSAVNRVSVGDFVIVPFTHGCGSCRACQQGFDGDCLNYEAGPLIGYQAEYFRYRNADWALIKIPGQPKDYSDEQLNALLTLSDVMATGFHAAKMAEVKAGNTAVVIGDGAVGLCGVIAAKLLGAKRIIAMSKYPDRQALAREFGATDIVSKRGDEAVKIVMELTNQVGADAILECVGTEESAQTAIEVARPGAVVGRVGIPQSKTMDTANLFHSNIGLRGGIASVTTYVKDCLLEAVLSGQINPGKVFTARFSLEEIQAAYEAMDKRETIKSLLIFD